MSKFVKYVSSEHFGAPQMKGDRWGYCVEMLRKVLVDGFNERTDLNKIQVTTNEKFIASFATAHNYVANQTIKISDSAYPELNGDTYIESVNGLNVVCVSYNDLTSLVGQTLTVTCKSIVSPLGFKERFKDGNKSAFQADDPDGAFLVIDDREVTSTSWKASAGGATTLICPIVYMTDKMTDINTDGRLISPYDSANPDWYKKVDYKIPTNAAGNYMGIWNWFSFGLMTSSTAQYPNTVAQQQTVVKWEIIGNGRFFFYMPYIDYGVNKRHFLYSFGKIQGSNINNNNYMLYASPGHTGNNQYGSFTYLRIGYEGCVQSYSNIYNNTTLNGFKIDTGSNWCSLLSVNGKPSAVYFSTNNALRYSTANINTASGLNGNYPDFQTKKYYVQKYNVYSAANDLVGTMPGLLWSSNSSNIYSPDGRIFKYKYKSKTKKMYVYNAQMSGVTNGDLQGSGTQNIYNISLEYEDWNNYE